MAEGGKKDRVADVVQQAASPSSWVKYRLALLALFLLALLVVGKYSGWTAELNAQRIRDVIVATGPWGWVLYLGLFVGGQFIHIPGMVFVVAGLLVYGSVFGLALAFGAALVAVSVSFVFVRSVGGTPMQNIRNAWVRRSLAHLDAHPVRTVFLVRLMFWLNPVVNTALALTPLRFRDHLLGSALGLLPPIAFVAVFLEWFLALE